MEKGKTKNKSIKKPLAKKEVNKKEVKKFAPKLVVEVTGTGKNARIIKGKKYSVSGSVANILIEQGFAE